MPLTRLFSAAFTGLEALLVEVEVDLTPKAGFVRIVGMADAAVKESKDRVLLAIKNSHYPIDDLSCTIHLAPAEVKKVGAFYDLPIALGILANLRVFSPEKIEQYLIGGELGLSGELRPISGALSLALLAKKLGKRGILIPAENVQEASLVSDIQVIPLFRLSDAVTFFKTGQIPHLSFPPIEFKPYYSSIDMSAIKGQWHAKRALEIAAAGGHNVLMCGPPGTGKTMLAKAFSGILPPLSFEEALEITNIYSLAGLKAGIIQTRPFRSPHHTVSYAGMIGGGTHPKPGEISLAHNGVLFLDELPEFARSTLEVLRQPLEDGEVTISRSGGRGTFPTHFICIAAMNPCPCGYLGHPEKPCQDSSLQVQRYRQRISGPFLDRMDMQIQVHPVSYHDILKMEPQESSEQIRARVINARERLPSIEMYLSSSCEGLIKEVIKTLSLSARSYKRLLSVARTIAALENLPHIGENQLIEALSYRQQLN